MKTDSEEDFKSAFAATPKPQEPPFLRARLMHEIRRTGATPRNPVPWMAAYAAVCIAALEYFSGMKGQSVVLAPLACLVYAARRPILRAFAPFLR